MLVAASAWLSRIVLALVQLTSIRLILQHMGSEPYAVFALLTGLTNWFLLADLGLGPSVQNFIAEKKAKDEPYDGVARNALAVGFISFLCLAATAAVFARTVAPAYLHQFNSLGRDRQAILLFITTTCGLATAAGTIVYRIWYGEHRGYLSNIFSTAAGMLALAAMWVTVKSDAANKLECVLLSYTLPPALLPLAGALVRFCKAPNMSTPWRSQDWRIVIRRAMRFSTFALLSTAVLNVDYLVMSQSIGPSEITAYAVVTKVIGFSLTIYVAAVLALGPVLTELYTKGEWDRARTLLHKYLLGGFFFVGACAIIFALLRAPITSLFALSDSRAITMSLITFTGAYFILRVWADTHAIALLSVNRLRPLILWVPVQAALNVCLQYTMANLFGVLGIVLGLSLSCLATVAWVLPLQVRSVMPTGSAARAP